MKWLELTAQNTFYTFRNWDDYREGCIEVSDDMPSPLLDWVWNFDLKKFEAPVIPTPTLDEVKTSVISQIKEIRKNTLDLFQKKSTGVMTIYQENRVAATRFLSSDASLMTNGLTPEEYLIGLGSKIGMTATQFANWVLSENQRLAPTVYEVEQVYLDLAYVKIPNCTQINNVIDEYGNVMMKGCYGYLEDYQTFVAPITGE